MRMIKRCLKKLYYYRLNQRGEAEFGAGYVVGTLGVVIALIIAISMAYTFNGSMGLSRALDTVAEAGSGVSNDIDMNGNDIWDIGSLTADILNAPTGRTATYVIAASDATATEKAQADVVVVGTADDEINAALTALPATGGTVALIGNDFDIANTIQMYSYQNLIGDGTAWYLGGVNLNLSAAHTCIQIGDGTVGAVCTSVRNVHINGNSRSYANTVRGISITSPMTGGSAPAGYCAMIQVENVRVSEFTGEGLLISGVQDSQFKNVIIAACGEVAGGKGAVYLVSNTTTVQAAANIFEGLDIEASYYYGVILDKYATMNRFLACKIDVSQASGGFWIEGYHNLIDGLIYGVSLNGAYKAVYVVENGGAHAYGNRITNSVFTSSSGALMANYDAIYFQSSGYGNYANNNIIRYFQYGVKSNGTKDIITGNKITDCTCDLSLTGSSPIVEDNELGTAGWLIFNGTPTTPIISNNQGYIASGESRTYSFAITAGGAATITAWQNPNAQDCLVKEVTVRVATGDADAPNGDCGVVANATTVGTTIFSDLTGETTGVYYSYTAAGGGTQTLPIVLNAAAGANDYLTFTWSDNDSTSCIATAYVTLVGI